MPEEVKFKRYIKTQKEYADFRDQFGVAFWEGQHEKKEIKRGMTKSDVVKLKQLRAIRKAAYKEWLEN